MTLGWLGALGKPAERRCWVQLGLVWAGSSGLLQPALEAQPIGDAIRPGSDRVLRASEAIAVAALGIDVQFQWDFLCLQGEGVMQHVADADGIVLGHDQKSGGGLRRGGHLGRNAVLVVLEAEVAGVDEHGEVRTQGLVVSVVDAGVGALRGLGEGGGEVASGGESQGPDAFGVETPARTMIPKESHGSLGILQRCRVSGAVGSGGHPVFEQGAGDAQIIQPGADFGAFQIEGENVVASPGADQDGGPGVAVGGWPVQGEGGMGHMAQADDGLAIDQAVGGTGDVAFRLFQRLSFAWWMVGPKGDGIGGGSRVAGQGERKSGGDQEKGKSHGGRQAQGGEL